jgi:protein involved in polysaccharide export with SLBB domain
MRHGRHARRLARLGSFLGICAWGAQTLCPNQALAGSILDRLRPAASQAATLTPRTILAWSIDSGPEHAHVMAGKEIIGPDGSLVLGPYGSVHVAGLTPHQAEIAIERHLAAYVASPRVRLTVERAGSGEAPAAVPAAPARSPVSNPTAPAPTFAPQQQLPQAPTTVLPAPATAPPAPASVETPQAAGTVSVQQVAQLGAPAPSDEAGPPAAEWRPVQPIALTAATEPAANAAEAGPTVGNWRPVSQVIAPAAATVIETPASTWRPAPRPAQAGIVATSFGAPMPVGPVEGPALASQPADPKKADELKMPRPVPGPHEGVIVDPGAAFPGGPPPDAGPPPTECHKRSLPNYVVEPPDILIVASTQQIRDQSISGQHLVRPDGSLSLGIYGTVWVAGLTLEQTKEAIAQLLDQRIKDFDRKNLYVDVLAYNSKFYYVITDGGGYGEQVVRLPITGSETVLDGISQIYGLPAVASKKDIWVARSFPCQGGHGSEQVLPVDWCGITQRAQTATNYQIMPGDRIYVKAQRLIRVDSALAKVISPIERILGVTLLGSTTVNSIRTNPNATGTGSGVP